MLYLFFILFLVLLEPSSCSSMNGNQTCAPKLDDKVRPYFLQLKEKVKEDLREKVPEDFIEKVLCMEDLSFNPDLMVRSLTWKEIKLPYYQFFDENRIERAYQFMHQHFNLLSAIEEKFNVDKEVLVSILLIETDLGRKTGKHSVLNTYFSLALSGQEELFLRYLPANGEVDLNNETTKIRYQRRVKWAYGELLHTLDYLYRHNLSPFELKGSIFGAFGYPQFVPSSFFVYGYDWDGDGQVDLFSYPDALASIANYLAKEGYKRVLPEVAKQKVIMKYNKSEPYAQTVLGIAGILKKRWEGDGKRVND